MGWGRSFAGRHERGRPRDWTVDRGGAGRFLSPIGFLVGSQQGSLTEWPSTGRANPSERGDAGVRSKVRSATVSKAGARKVLGRGKRLNCALRAEFPVSGYFARGKRVGPAARRSCPRSIWFTRPSMRGTTPNCFFTESLILAQNERWRRV